MHIIRHIYTYIDTYIDKYISTDVNTCTGHMLTHLIIEIKHIYSNEILDVRLSIYKVLNYGIKSQIYKY